MFSLSEGRDAALVLHHNAQGYISVRVLGRVPEAAVQKLDVFVELAAVHVAEAQIEEEVGIIGVLVESNSW